MPKSAAERMSAYRLRKRASGLTTLSLLVPKDAVPFFRELAEEWRGQSTAISDDIQSGQRRMTGRADLIAAKILQQIISVGWPVGQSLGSEAELMQQFNVSRSVLRQAIRLLEHYGVARVQRGVTGGLLIDAPDASATGRAVGIYLEYRRIRPTDILETRKILERATITLAVERLTRDGEIRLLNEVAMEAQTDAEAEPQSWQRLHFAVAELSGDPALNLFAAVILRLSESHSNFSRRSKAERAKVVSRIKKLHRGIVDAMVSHDAETACCLVERYLDGYREWMD